MEAYKDGNNETGYKKMKEAKELWIENYEHLGCKIAIEMGEYYKKLHEIQSR